MTLVGRTRTSIVAGLLCCLIAVPCRAGGAPDAALDEAYSIVKRRRLLTPSELACSLFVSEGEERGVSTVAIREKHGGRCGGDPEVAPIRFHMEIDRAGRRVRWDNNGDMQMRPVPGMRAASSRRR